MNLIDIVFAGDHISKKVGAADLGDKFFMHALLTRKF